MMSSAFLLSAIAAIRRAKFFDSLSTLHLLLKEKLFFTEYPIHAGAAVRTLTLNR